MIMGLEVRGIAFHASALVERPEHAAILGRIFTSWSLIEATVAGQLGLMMHAEPRAATAILSTFHSNSRRVDAVRKVAKEMLGEVPHQNFDKLMLDVKSYASTRNKIAHGLWGVQKDELDIVYRMPMEPLSDFIVEALHQDSPDFGAIALLEKSITEVSLSDLEKIEQDGQKLLERLMATTINRDFLEKCDF